MTRKFFYLIAMISFLFLTSCSLLESDSSSNSPSELEGELANFDDSSSDDTVAESSDEDFDEFDVENASEASASSAKEKNKDSFSEIEDFNDDMIENELSKEELSDDTAVVAKASDIEEIPEDNNIEEDLDLESANFEEPPPASSTPPPPMVAAAPEESVSAPTNNITNLEYKSQDSGGSVVISADHPFEYQVRDEPQFNQTVIEVQDVNLASRFKQPYIAKDFGQPVATINAYQERGSNVATVVIQYKEATKPNITMVGNSLLVKSGGVSTTKPSYVANAAVTFSEGAGGATPDGEVRHPGDDKRINIQLDDIPVSDLIKIIADEIGFNVIVDEDVTGKVNNVKLVDVPWREALSSILGAQGLAYERKGQIVRIAKVDKLTKELNSTRERLEAEASAKTAASTLTIKVVPVSYADLTSLQAQVQPVLTPGKGKVTPDLRSNSIVIYDLEDNVKRAEQIIKSLDVKPIQVLVEGRIIEAKSSFLRQFGIRWGTQASPGSSLLTGGIQGNSDDGPGKVGGGFLGNVTFGSFGGLDSLTAALAVYEREEKVKILSSPRIMTINKEKAVIKQTEQLQITTTTFVQGVGAQNQTSFRDAVLQVEVTPQVTFNSDMILDISVKRDVPGAVYNNSRAINAREAQAKVLVKDGNSVVMGGILSMDDVLTEAGVPLLKDIPILGYLFKTKKKDVSKNELVVFVQPKIINSDSLSKGMQLSELETASPLTPPPSKDSDDDFDAEDLDKEMESL